MLYFILPDTLMEPTIGNNMTPESPTPPYFPPLQDPRFQCALTCPHALSFSPSWQLCVCLCRCVKKNQPVWVETFFPALLLMGFLPFQNSSFKRTVFKAWHWIIIIHYVIYTVRMVSVRFENFCQTLLIGRLSTPLEASKSSEYGNVMMWSLAWCPVEVREV